LPSSRFRIRKPGVPVVVETFSVLFPKLCWFQMHLFLRALASCFRA
jgi:hypothetical protein